MSKAEVKGLVVSKLRVFFIQVRQKRLVHYMVHWQGIIEERIESKLRDNLQALLFQS